MTDTDSKAKYAVGDRLDFHAHRVVRAPFGTVIPDGLVVVTEVVDHGRGTAYAPRFSYIVRAFDGSVTQGTDERELTELPETEPEPMIVSARDGRVDMIYASRIDAAASAARHLDRGARVWMSDVWTVRVYDDPVAD